MSNCLGVPLNDNIGICVVHVPYEDNQVEFKLFVRAKSDNSGVIINGYLPVNLNKRYYEFEHFYVVNEKSEKKVSVKKGPVDDYLFVEEETRLIGPSEQKKTKV